jgi:hypothetical protein
MVLDLIRRRLVSEFPAIVSVPETVWLAESENSCVLLAGPVRVRVANVLAPEIDTLLVVVVAIVTTLNVRPPALKTLPPFAVVNESVEVLALNVRLVVV